MVLVDFVTLKKGRGLHIIDKCISIYNKSTYNLLHIIVCKKLQIILSLFNYLNVYLRVKLGLRSTPKQG